MLAVAQALSAPEGLGPALLTRRDVLAGALALLNPAHLLAVVSYLVSPQHEHLESLAEKLLWRACMHTPQT